jgi:hypothetical protein
VSVVSILVSTKKAGSGRCCGKTLILLHQPRWIVVATPSITASSSAFLESYLCLAVGTVVGRFSMNMNHIELSSVLAWPRHPGHWVDKSVLYQSLLDEQTAA